MDSLAPAPPDIAESTTLAGTPPGRVSARIAARLRLGAGAVIVLLLLALAVAVLVSLLTPTGASATLERPLGPGGESSHGASAGASSGGTDSLAGDPRPSTPASAGATAAPAPEHAARPLLVHVLGAVASPGLFELPVGARVMDAIAAAGGLAPGADQVRINLARQIADGEQLYVPAVGEAVPVPALPGSATSEGGVPSPTSPVIDLNTATVADLDTLPRIGPELAQRIVEWRAANGPFRAPEDLLEVPGIGDRTFEGLRERVTV